MSIATCRRCISLSGPTAALPVGRFRDDGLPAASPAASRVLSAPPASSCMTTQQRSLPFRVMPMTSTMLGWRKDCAIDTSFSTFCSSSDMSDLIATGSPLNFPWYTTPSDPWPSSTSPWFPGSLS